MKTALRQRRKGEGLTQAKVAKQANISIRHYQYIEAGERLPNVYTAQLIATALNATVEQVFPPESPSAREAGINPKVHHTTIHNNSQAKRGEI